eukprot:g31798.t1
MPVFTAYTGAVTLCQPTSSPTRRDLEEALVPETHDQAQVLEEKLGPRMLQPLVEEPDGAGLKAQARQRTQEDLTVERLTEQIRRLDKAMTKMLDFIELENHRPMELWLQETPEFPAEVGGVGVQPGEAEKRNPQEAQLRALAKKCQGYLHKYPSSGQRFLWTTMQKRYFAIRSNRKARCTYR